MYKLAASSSLKATAVSVSLVKVSLSYDWYFWHVITCMKYYACNYFYIHIRWEFFYQFFIQKTRGHLTIKHKVELVLNKCFPENWRLWMRVFYIHVIVVCVICGICELHVWNFELVLFWLQYKYELNSCQLQFSLGRAICALVPCIDTIVYLLFCTPKWKIQNFLFVSRLVLTHFNAVTWLSLSCIFWSLSLQSFEKWWLEVTLYMHMH